MTFGIIASIFLLIFGGLVMCILGLLLVSIAIDLLEDSETGRRILDRITKRKR